MQNMEYLKPEEMLRLPVSTSSYIILRDYALHHGNVMLWRKLIGEYLNEIPVFELFQLLSFGKIMLQDIEFESIVEMILSIRK